MPAARRPPPRPEPAVTNRTWWLVAAVAVVVCGLAAWLLWPREDKLGLVSELQQRLLAAGGAPGRADVDRLIRTVDRMSRDELRAAYAAAGAEWKRIKQAAVDTYFAAAASDRPRLLDEHLDRMVAYHDLLAAMNPGDQPGAPAYLPRQRRRRDESEPAKTPAELEAERSFRDLAERFDAALEARAKDRGVALPAFR